MQNSLITDYLSTITSHQTNVNKKEMRYPLVSDYVDSILLAEKNFATLTNLRPVIDENNESR